MRNILALSAVVLLASQATAHVVEAEPTQMAEDFGTNMVQAYEEIDVDYLNEML